MPDPTRASAPPLTPVEQVVYDALYARWVDPNDLVRSACRDEARVAVAALGIRETCWRCGHHEGHDNHVPFTLSDWHDYMPVLVVHPPKEADRVATSG